MIQTGFSVHKDENNTTMNNKQAAKSTLLNLLHLPVKQTSQFIDMKIILHSMIYLFKENITT